VPGRMLRGADRVGGIAAVLGSADPIAALRARVDYNSAFATKFAAKLEESAAKELQGATSRVLGYGASSNAVADGGRISGPAWSWR
jgi:hypothetical protein